MTWGWVEPMRKAKAMRSSEFMGAVPEAVQPHLPRGLVLRRGRVWPWGVQLYDDDPRYHYEVARVPERMGDRLELGLHFESRVAMDNQELLAGFAARLVELKAELGDAIEAEPWDRGWTKVYQTMALEPYNDAYLDQVARRLGKMVSVLHPIYAAVRRSSIQGVGGSKFT